jgi:putative pyoverdin transport system ATP-binding/permease protein
MIAQFPRFIYFLVQRSRSMMVAMVGAGALSGICSAAVLALINRVLQQRHDDGVFLAIGFIVVVAGKLFTQVVSQTMLARFSQDNTLDLSLKLCEKILKAPFQRIESQGPSNILVTLSDDVSMLAWAIQCLPNLAMNAAIVVGCGIYLAWLSLPTFLLVVAATLLGAWGYHWLHTRAFATIYSSREARALLFRQFRSLTEGIKELVMHDRRRKEFLNTELYEAADLYRRNSIEASKQYAFAEAWSQLAFYAMIGVILFVFPRLFSLPSESLIGYVVVLLYMMNPIWGIIGVLPTLEKGQVAFDNIQRLGVSLDEWVGSDNGEALVESVLHPVVQFKGVIFTYARDVTREHSFQLGPIDIEIEPGKLLFVIGGNGSGKSTFVKVLAGLYCPQEGEILLGGTVVSDTNRAWYRDHYSVVFSDFFLFEKLLGLEEALVESQAHSYLSRLRMDHKVVIKGRAFSTTDLSQGQRKRLALVTAYLEDRAIYVFDEWAADQDPEYKEIFYNELLPDLRARGKSVVVITHDDRYFHLGDRVLTLEDGKVVDSAIPGVAVPRLVSRA